MTKRWLHAYEGNLLDAAKVLDLTEDGNIVAIRVAELIERMKGPRKHERRETARAAPVASRVSYVTDDPTVDRRQGRCSPLREPRLYATRPYVRLVSDQHVRQACLITVCVSSL